MKPKKAPSPADAWDIPACETLMRELWALRESMLRNEVRLAPWLRQADSTHTASAANLAHYLALRRHEEASLAFAKAAEPRRLSILKKAHRNQVIGDIYLNWAKAEEARGYLGNAGNHLKRLIDRALANRLHRLIECQLNPMRRDAHHQQVIVLEVKLRTARGSLEGVGFMCEALG